jgi:hypothetical protein
MNFWVCGRTSPPMCRLVMPCFLATSTRAVAMMPIVIAENGTFVEKKSCGSSRSR